MNVTDARQSLLKWFSEHDFFSFKQFKQLILISEFEDEEKAAIRAGLNSLEKDLIIDKAEHDKKEYWIIRQSFQNFIQNVAISPTVALALSELINEVAEKIGSKELSADASNIKEKDIIALISIISTLKK